MLIEHSFLLKYLQLPHLGRILENMGKQKANVYFSLWKGVIWLALKLTDGKGHRCADLPPLCPTPWKFVTSRVLCTKSHSLVFHWKGVLALFSNYSEGMYHFLIKWKVSWRQNCVVQLPAKYHALPINTYAYSFLFVSDPEKSQTVFQI